MKKFFALCLAFSTLTVLPLTGCGGSSTPDPSPQAMATLSSGAESRGVQISWTPQYTTSERYTVIEYHVIRQPTDAPEHRTLVGVTSPTRTTFTDTVQNREVSFNSPVYDALGSTTQAVPGLTNGTYTYSVDTLYRDNTATRTTPPNTNPRIYDYSYIIRDTEPVRFE